MGTDEEIKKKEKTDAIEIEMTPKDTYTQRKDPRRPPSAAKEISISGITPAFALQGGRGIGSRSKFSLVFFQRAGTIRRQSRLLVVNHSPKDISRRRVTVA